MTRSDTSAPSFLRTWLIWTAATLVFPSLAWPAPPWPVGSTAHCRHSPAARSSA